MQGNAIKVMCEGQGNNQVSQHPRIYLQVQENSKVTCPYCGKEFVYEPSEY
jgi:uncharacterized Zn-finger protein